jgi:hypothetical protein
MRQGNSVIARVGDFRPDLCPVSEMLKTCELIQGLAPPAAPQAHPFRLTASGAAAVP